MQVKVNTGDFVMEFKVVQYSWRTSIELPDGTPIEDSIDPNSISIKDGQFSYKRLPGYAGNSAQTISWEISL